MSYELKYQGIFMLHFHWLWSFEIVTCHLNTILQMCYMN